MLNIPASIQTLFKTDGTRKNFRAHFPGGELPDITNANVVQESVRFTESLCSQNVFRFGLAEASMIEFETVGVANMYGLTIECGIEIDTSSLSGAEISGIQSDPGDGTLVLAADSDIGYGFYRVPYGVFRVESCPRNHGAMTHRRVTGYAPGLGALLALSPVERWKETQTWGANTINVENVESLIDANTAWTDPAYIDANYTKTQITASTTESVLLQGGNVSTLQYTVTGSWRCIEFAKPQSGDNLVQYDPVAFDYPAYADVMDDLETQLETAAADLRYGSSGRDTLLGYARIILTALERGPILNKAAVSNLPRYSNGYQCAGGIPIALFPETGVIARPMSIFVTLRGPSAADPSQTISRSVGVTLIPSATAEQDVVYQLTPVVPSGFPITLKASGAASKTSFYFVDTYDIRALFTAWTELHGRFANADRHGELAVIELDPSAPQAVLPGDYSDCWWDEYDVDDIGTVTVTYLEADVEEQTATVSLGSGASVYDMTDNEALKTLSGLTLANITTLLSGDFADNAANVGFTPTDLTMQGWPWLEAGDALEITAEDNAVVDTYALRLEISGIQQLTADIQSQGGEILGEV